MSPLRIFSGLVVLLALGGVIAGCGSSTSPTTESTVAPLTTVVTEAAGATSQGTGAQVVLRDGTVKPTELVVSVGTAVTFVDADDDTSRTYHLVSATGSFDTGLLAEGGSYIITFQQPVTIEYHDKEDPSMKGRIIVQ